ncbi:zinc metallopeptidase [Azoarcus taiwanensis]|uniref:Peptidase n=1 Tax=Azoarcus taiwanensis TaxID=666964 RepID=A0A972J7B3_9RHOO|nr:zinc metallopeptidase [Azoarcus taiwanensis]NMG01584.1 peptidase [Azoarcus taiwanensis]
MTRLLLFLLPILMLAVWLPGWWVRRTMQRYSEPADRYYGSGSMLARLLLDKQGLKDVAVELSEIGDHYDPQARAVRLSPNNFHQRSLTAITVAAHEVGHAVQHANGYAPLAMREHLVRMAMLGQRLGAMMMVAVPFITVIARHPAPGLMFVVAGLLSMGLAALVHLVTLPTEFDASFRRAMPMLESGDYLHRDDYPHARRILEAAALTYVAQSLMALLNIAAWMRFLRR